MLLPTKKISVFYSRKRFVKQGVFLCMCTKFPAWLNIWLGCENGPISGKVLVYKHPGLHFGDIHVLNAIAVNEMEHIVGNAKYAIFFPTQGPRSLADEIANSDFDGDLYWVSQNPQTTTKSKSESVSPSMHVTCLWSWNLCNIDSKGIEELKKYLKTGGARTVTAPERSALSSTFQHVEEVVVEDLLEVEVDKEVILAVQKGGSATLLPILLQLLRLLGLLQRRHDLGSISLEKYLANLVVFEVLLSYFQESEPWKRVYSTNNICTRKPTEFSDEELEKELFQQFLTTRFQPSNTMGVAADSWLAFMDRILTLGGECASEKECVKEKMLKLVDIYYDALDAPKTGMKVEVPEDFKADKFPHFMERTNSYVSTSILGLIYDKVDSIKTENPSSEEEWKLSCFDYDLPQACLELWKKHYDQYRGEMKFAMKLDGESKNESANKVIQKYKQILYGAVGFKESTRKREEIFNEALAIYRATYDYAKTKGAVSYCSFAWKVAGPVLCELHAIKQGGESIVCLPSVLREVIN
ncbi:hypothetical protein HHK36_021679 [Tetracentron sinense]|uniref:RNA-dependent RNA polymerase n=1 Tax=Tetracentron sinense TaxID=13715 RepID=A0A834YU44_TETSI|nr:hypothetical protein HHK36_021679 [Tetracentron sinense]